MVANYLQQCGVHIGDTLYPADVGNPKGYYEDVDFLEFHRDLLTSLSLSIFPTKDEHFCSLIPEEFETRAREIVRRKQYSLVWGWKDCRTALFLEFWHKIIPNIKVLFLIRNPVYVVDSLLRRGTDPIIQDWPALGFKAWFVYNQKILNYYLKNEGNCYLAEINNFLQDPVGTVSRLFSKLELNLPIEDFGLVYSRGAFQENLSLRHAYRLLRNVPLSVRCLRLYWYMTSL